MNLNNFCPRNIQNCGDFLNELVWLPEFGIGYYPVKEAPYDDEYFSSYLDRDDAPEGKCLTNHRVRMLNGCDGSTIDIGIGGGKFVKEKNCYGFDINPKAVDWLQKECRFLNPYRVKVENLTFWDSLEHIHDPAPILMSAKKNVFISMPIYRDSTHVLTSKHFKKDEHCWYFTDNGLKLFMSYFGFKFVSSNTGEQPIREDIVSYHFRRVNEGT